MFCKIDITGSNNLTRANNFYRGVHAVATAAAGSTPSVNNPSGGDIITSVISNTVAEDGQHHPLIMIPEQRLVQCSK